MDIIIGFFRDTLSGFTYFIYASVILFLIFAIIGYFITKKYQSSNSLTNTKVAG